jgi:hypothetical protein
MAIIPANEKVFMVSNGTNTTYGGSAALKAMQQWYTMQDVIDTVGGGGGGTYQVFTALLSQNGSSDPNSQGDGDLVIGRTYYINTNNNGGNFLNVGAPSNDVGTYFIATGTTPTSWGATPGNLSNINLIFNLGAPVATILENTIGDVYFIYDSDGYYYLLSAGLFTPDKTAILGGFANTDTGVFVNFRRLSADEILILSGDPAPANGYLDNLTIEIRVYN